MNYAPIVLFVYNRLEHTKKTVEALRSNYLSDKSNLFIYSDGPKSDLDISSVAELRSYIRSISGFKKVTLVERPKNLGLSKSIILGVSEVCQNSGKVIVLEDDMITSSFFLEFMNEALSKFESDERVWSINGYTYPIEAKDLNETFFWRVADCWGWATWEDRWKYFEKNPKKLISDFTSKDILKFNIDGSLDLWDQVLKNNKGQLDTWAVFWYAAAFKRGALSLNPSVSLVKNIGLDGTGENCLDHNPFDSLGFPLSKPEIDSITIYEDKEALKRVKRYLNSIKPSSFEVIALKFKNILTKTLYRRTGR